MVIKQDILLKSPKSQLFDSNKIYLNPVFYIIKKNQCYLHLRNRQDQEDSDLLATVTNTLKWQYRIEAHFVGSQTGNQPHGRPSITYPSILSKDTGLKWEDLATAMVDRCVCGPRLSWAALWLDDDDITETNTTHRYMYVNLPGTSISSVRCFLLKGSVWELSRWRSMIGRSMMVPLPGRITGSFINVSIKGSGGGERITLLVKLSWLHSIITYIL